MEKHGSRSPRIKNARLYSEQFYISIVGDQKATEREMSYSFVGAVIAALNEEAGIGPTIEEFRQYMGDAYLIRALLAIHGKQLK